MQSFFRVIQKHRFSFLFLPGIVSLGVGIKTTRNFFTGIPSIILGVKKKLPPHAVPRDQFIPRVIDNLPTDVLEVGRINLLGHALPWPANPPGEQADFRKKRIRPAQPGVSIGHYKSATGTLGAVVKGNFEHGIAILSNNHVLANGTSGNDGLARIGDAVLQPGPYDDGTAEDTIARLHSYSPLIPEKKGSQINSIDAALAVPIRPDLVTGQVLGLGPVRDTSPARTGMLVYKSGRSSGVTRGRVFSMGTTIRVDNENKTYVFEDQIGIRAKSEPGDSGSLVVSQYGRAVGLLFAGSDNYTFANPIDNVLKYFGVSLYDK